MAGWIRRHALTPSTDTLIRATVIVSVILVGLAAATLWLTAQGRLGDARAQKSDDLRSCTTSFSDELVTGPTAAALKALAEHGVDSPQFKAAVAKAEPGRFARLARMSREDPDGFLAVCRARDGG